MFLIRHPFLVIFSVALVESMLLAKVGTTIGWGMTIGLILLSTMVGSMMMRQQGFQTFRRLQIAMARGENPGPEILEGVMIMAGGLLLMTPGFISDSIGFFLLIPLTRKALVALLAKRLANLPLAANVVQDQWSYDYRPGRGYRAAGGQDYAGGRVYEGGQVYEGERVDVPASRPTNAESIDVIMVRAPVVDDPVRSAVKDTNVAATKPSASDASAGGSAKSASSPGQTGVIEGEFLPRED
jgi:UPF0716 protein FxsA